jgi:hypothetical protein
VDFIFTFNPMQKLFTLVFVFCTLAIAGQNKKAPNAKPVVKNDPLSQLKSWESTDTGAVTDSSQMEVKVVEPAIPREFLVYTKKPKQKTDRTKLCFNLVNKDTVLNYCVNDSICREPETYKILHETKIGDTTYVLILVDAFTKGHDDPRCDAGKETKLVFFRWNTKTNKAKIKQKSVSSCVRNIVNMTKEPIASWDGSSVLEVSYYKGGSDFPVVKFDPAQVQLGLQDLSEAEPR